MARSTSAAGGWSPGGHRVRPRSMTIAEDGRALYVVNYRSGTVSKVRTSDLRVLQVVRTNRHPIGIAYDVHHGAGRVWVACYTGTIMVFKDS